jgi:hypothetical protein
MARLNLLNLGYHPRTNEGAPARHITPEFPTPPVGARLPAAAFLVLKPSFSKLDLCRVLQVTDKGDQIQAG